MASSNLDDLVRRVERMDIDALMTVAIELVRRGQLDLAETFVERAAHLIRMRRLTGGG